MTDNKSYLENMRLTYRPKLPATLRCPVRAVEGEPTQSVADQEAIQALFPCTYGMPELTFERDDSAMPPEKPFNVGVILSGGQAPGGHNVICGLYDGIKALNKYCRLYGFLGGPNGLVKHRYRELTEDVIEQYRNTGGFDIIGSGRTKLESPEQFEAGLNILRELNITAVVIIGGDDSNTNAAVLAEYYKAHDAGVQVIGVPKTIDGDLKNDHIEISFGFDTATKVYSELIGNVARDCNSAKKYWHFMKLMGRSASHIALECALQTRPNYCIISEEVEARNMTLHDIAEEIADIVKCFPKVKLLDRPDFLLGDMVSIQPLIEYDIQHSSCDFFLQTHSTNPCVEPETYEKAIEAFFSQTEHDALFSVTEIKSRFYWPDGRGINHDPKHLIRTQDLEPIYEENSCFYLFSRETNEKVKNRLGSNPMMYPIESLEAADIDYMEDFYWCEFLLNRKK